jgi:uncharacterized membrane protein
LRQTFIDVLRLFAIIMMLQGHFVHLTLDINAVSQEHWLYQTWLFGRGNTAPLFFSISGFIVAYILLQKEGKALKKQFHKNLKRGITLVLIGYALRLHLGTLFSGKINQTFLQIDVLHCIGLSVIALSSCIYLLRKSNSRSLKALFFIGLACLIFMFDPLREELHFTKNTAFFSNYLTQDYGSVFTLFPWMGYAFFGAGLSTLWNIKTISTYAKTGFMLVFGWMLINSSLFFIWCHEFTGILVFKEVAYNNYLFIRLGYVFIIIAIFNSFSNQVKLPKPLNILSKNTLTIYVIHFALLYGSWFRFGIKQLFYHNLSPFFSALGAVLFVLCCCGLCVSYIKTKPLVQQQYKLLKFMVFRRIVQRRISLSA